MARVHVEPTAFPVLTGDTLFVRLGNGTRAVTDPAEIDRYSGICWSRP